MSQSKYFSQYYIRHIHISIGTPSKMTLEFTGITVLIAILIARALIAQTVAFIVSPVPSLFFVFVHID